MTHGLVQKMVDVAALSTYVVWICTCNVRDWRKESKCTERRQSLVELGEQLVKPLITRRLDMPMHLRQNITDAISTVADKLNLTSGIATMRADRPQSG